MSRVQHLEAAFRRIAETRMAGLPILHPRLAVEAVGFAADAEGIATGVLVTPWFMNLVRLPLGAEAEPSLPGPGQAEDLCVGGWTFRFFGHDEAGLGRFAAASLVSPMGEFEDQAAAVATARELLLQLRPPRPARTAAPERPARRSFLFGSSGQAAPAPAPTR